MRWLCVVALLMSASAGCSKKNGGHNNGQLPDGFISSSCTSDAECDDGDPCTDDVCGTDQMCSNAAKDCSAVVDDCNSASCDSMTGDCVGVAKREGKSCSDNFGNTGTCMAGNCVPTPQCNAGFSFLDCTSFGHQAMDDTSSSFDTFDTYKCAMNETGPELGYSFFADNDTLVTVTLDASVDLDLLVLNSDICDATADCAGTPSLTPGSGHEKMTFNAVGGQGYTIVVEGHNGAMGPFTLTVDCASCAPVRTLDCNTSVADGDTTSTSATNAVNSWSCDPSTGGPEETYRLAPNTNTDYSIKLTGMTQDLDLLVVEELSGSCDNTCVSDASSIKTGTAPETVAFSASGGTVYDVVVDSKSAGSSFGLEIDCTPSCLGVPGNLLNCAVGSVTGRNDDAAKSTNRVGSWKCDPNTTGREVIYQFTPATTGVYDFDLFGLTDDLDLIIVLGTAGACDPTALNCLNDPSTIQTGTTPEHVEITATKGQHYYVAVDGKPGVTGNYTLRISSPAGACPAWDCTPATGTTPAIGCTWIDDRGRNDDPVKSKNVVDTWSCDPDATGPEVVYQFKAPSSGTFTATLDELDAPLDLIVLPGNCNPLASCTANLRPSPSPSPSPSPTPAPGASPLPESVTFNTSAGTTYNIIVDGPDGAVGNYHISLSGSCAANTKCQDGNDPIDCFTTSTTGSNADPTKATNFIDTYGSCDSDLTGPEVAHLFSPGVDGPVTVTLTGMTADLDLIVLNVGVSNSCDYTTACVAEGTTVGTGDESVTFTAVSTKSYWLIVDGRDGAISNYTLSVTAGCF
jgi:hypothetical protein